MFMHPLSSESIEMIIGPLSSVKGNLCIEKLTSEGTQNLVCVLAAAVQGGLNEQIEGLNTS